MRIALILSAIAALLSVAVPGFADDNNVEAEIEYLLTAVGDSGCAFLRNGAKHRSDDAEAHLRLKYQRGRRYASTTEAFIERLASASSITRRPYLIACEGAEPVPTGDWLTVRLQEYRETR